MNFRKEIENSKSRMKVQETKMKMQRRLIPPADTILLKIRSMRLTAHPKVTWGETQRRE